VDRNGIQLQSVVVCFGRRVLFDVREENSFFGFDENRKRYLVDLSLYAALFATYFHQFYPSFFVGNLYLFTGENPERVFVFLSLFICSGDLSGLACGDTGHSGSGRDWKSERCCRSVDHFSVFGDFGVGWNRWIHQSCA
jgi:hypothetical protein